MQKPNGEALFRENSNRSLMSATGLEAIGVKTYSEIGNGGKYSLNPRTDRIYICVDEEKELDGPNRTIEMKLEVEGQVQMRGDLTVDTKTGEILSKSLVVVPGDKILFGIGSQFPNGVEVDADAKDSDLFTFTGLATFADPACDCRTAVEIMGKTMTYLWAVENNQEPHQYVSTATAIQMLDRFDLRDNIDIADAGDDKVLYIANLFRLGFSEVEFTLKNKLQAHLQLLGKRGDGKEAGAALRIRVSEDEPQRSRLFPATEIEIISESISSAAYRFLYTVLFEEERGGETYSKKWLTSGWGDRKVSASSFVSDDVLDAALSEKLRNFYAKLRFDPGRCDDLNAEMVKIIELINAPKLLLVSPPIV